MIKKITVNGVASYKQEAHLETEEKVNLIYGFNGSGKTVIADYLQELDNEKFDKCSVENFDKENQKILVYNQNFIEKNFHNSETQKGIFTLAEDNVEAQKNIEGANNQKITKTEELGKVEQEEKVEQEKKVERNRLNAEIKIWAIKGNYAGGDRIFDKAGFLDGLKGIRKTLFNHIKDIPLEKVNKTIEQIENELSELGEEAEEREALRTIVKNDFLLIEENQIFQQEIIGNQDNVVSGLINKLNNSDWVKKGLDYVDLLHGKNCPFCQEETLTNELVDNIRNYFDEVYENNINELKQFKSKYANLIELIRHFEYKESFFTREQNLEKRNLFGNLVAICHDNLTKIEQKIAQPSLKITLESSKNVLDKVNTFIGERNKEIQEYNKKLQNREQVIRDLKKDFWRVLRREYNQAIENYNEQNKELLMKLSSIDKKIKDIKDEIKTQSEIIASNRDKVTNIDSTIDEINKHLFDFGISDFNIVKQGDTEYRIKRVDEDETKFKSLSEGEKMVITFLYFVELCRGKESKIDTKKKILVIDDPVSSLSHMYVFNVAELIKTYFINSNNQEIVQIFILTHNLYFFSELAGKKDMKVNLLRITKNKFSVIRKMHPNEIQNEYQAYWSIIKNSDETVILMANAMRNILEYFFGFMELRDSLKDIFEKGELSSNKYRSFRRYIDRESHSDPLNITDYKDFDDQIFQEAFEKVFEATGYQNHYNKMMG